MSIESIISSRRREYPVPEVLVSGVYGGAWGLLQELLGLHEATNMTIALYPDNQGVVQ